MARKVNLGNGKFIEQTNFEIKMINYFVRRFYDFL